MKNLAPIALLFCCSILALPGWAQDPATAPSQVTPAGPQLLEHLYQQLEKRERPVVTPGMPAFASSAMANADFMTTRQQLRTLGSRAYPLAPRVAELLLKTQNNQYDLAWILVELTVQEPSDAVKVAELLRKYRTETGAARLVELARIGKVRAAAVVPDLLEAVKDEAGATRMLAVIGLAFAGSTAVEVAAPALGHALSDKEKYIRSAAANSIRLLGARAESAAPALIEYLKTRDNVYAAAGALALMPIAAVRPAQQELESILTDTRLTEFQKRDVTNMLIRLETEK